MQIFDIQKYHGFLRMGKKICENDNRKDKDKIKIKFIGKLFEILQRLLNQTKQF